MGDPLDVILRDDLIWQLWHRDFESRLKLSPVGKTITVMERMSISSDGGHGSNRDTSNSVIGTISPSLGVGKSVEDTSGMFITGKSNNSLGGLKCNNKLSGEVECLVGYQVGVYRGRLLQYAFI